MISRFCKYCERDLEFENLQQFGAHIVNCEFYPDREKVRNKILEKNKSKRKKYTFRGQIFK